MRSTQNGCERIWKGGKKRAISHKQRASANGYAHKRAVCPVNSLNASVEEHEIRDDDRQSLIQHGARRLIGLGSDHQHLGVEISAQHRTSQKGEKQ